MANNSHWKKHEEDFLREKVALNWQSSHIAARLCRSEAGVNEKISRLKLRRDNSAQIILSRETDPIYQPAEHYLRTRGYYVHRVLNSFNVDGKILTGDELLQKAVRVKENTRLAA
ncbi:hypothetical protein [Sneathiella glossodoripedis]|uniref:hypothetical protein n=1 Tax=Sneathiella glossodoripedis TaxID=418853 RepID=UPI000470B682|nr:hypothetical protein [Sneathiella glossodoripedis]